MRFHATFSLREGEVTHDVHDVCGGDVHGEGLFACLVMFMHCSFPMRRGWSVIYTTSIAVLYAVRDSGWQGDVSVVPRG